MNTLLATLGTKLTERVSAALTLPGLAYLAVASIAMTVGHAHALDPAYLASQLDRAWQHYASQAAPAALVLTAAAALLAATFAGLIATALGAIAANVFTAAAPSNHWLARSRRRFKPSTAKIDPNDAAAAPAQGQPKRLTPIGTAFTSAGARVHSEYGLSVVDAWPRLMILAGTETRTMTADAYRRYRDDATTTAWGVLLLLLACWWWPAVLLAPVAIVAGYRRAVASANALAVIIESVVDVHQQQLAAAIGVDLSDGHLTPTTSAQINNRLTKGDRS
jgi:hypothetical protein